MPYQYKYQLAMRKSSFELESYSEGAIKIVLFAWVNHIAGMQCSIRSSSLATVPYSMENLLTCFQVILCLRNRALLDCCVTVLYKKKREFFCSQLHCIKFNVPRTNFSIKQPRRKNGLLQNRTRSTPS